MLRNKLIKLAKKLLPEIDSMSTSYIQALEQIINHRNLNASSIENENSLSIIIFSKDRAIQLQALLASYKELVKGNAVVKVLYTASTDEHAASYDVLRPMFAEVSFIKETSFRQDLIETLATISTNKLMFLVDDIIFKEPLDLDDFIKYDTNCFVPTLRMGNHLTYSYTTRLQQPLPLFKQDVLLQTGMLVWKWEEGILDWAYPLSVDGHIFDTLEIRYIIHSISFKAPNSLEESMQLFNPIYKSRYGLAMKKSVIMNIPNNKVQLENSNHAGSLSADFLLQKWQQGYQINYRKLRYFENISAHQEVELEFIKLDSK